jgi:uncharacterized damage-inducible protein DinB
MNLSTNISKHFREVYFGGNWTTSNYKQHLQDVDLTMATTQFNGLNTIATLVVHTHYYIHELIKVLEGGPLESKDEYSFILPPLNSEADWQQLLANVWKDAEKFAILISELPDSVFGEAFTDPKYGTYYRNLHGLIEHQHYHLGQIVLIKKLISQR